MIACGDGALQQPSKPKKLSQERLEIRPSESSHDFGKIKAFTSVATWNLILENKTEFPVTNISFSSNSKNFNITNKDQCTRIPANANCTISIGFVGRFYKYVEADYKESLDIKYGN